MRVIDGANRLNLDWWWGVSSHYALLVGRIVPIWVDSGADRPNPS